MAYFAVIEDGIVTNLIDAPDLETAVACTNTLCVEFLPDTSISIGWTYDGKDFTDPNPIKETELDLAEETTPDLIEKPKTSVK